MPELSQCVDDCFFVLEFYFFFSAVALLSVP
jgi:hypothetical protein